jgi:acyl-CoA dehydrogenase
VTALGEGGFLEAVVPQAFGGLTPALDMRLLALARQILAWRDGLADFAFATQALGSGAILLCGSQALQHRYLPAVAAGVRIAAFALPEPEAGADLNALTTTATPDGPDHVRLDGVKTFVAHGGIADHHVVIARCGMAPGGLSAFVVDADAPGLTVVERIALTAPQPLATLRFDAVRVPVAQRIGAPGEGVAVARATLDMFGPTIGAAAIGMGRRALDEATRHAPARQPASAATPADWPVTQAAAGDCATGLDAAELLVYRAAWAHDHGRPPPREAAAAARLFATGTAQRAIDEAMQRSGGAGLCQGSRLEQLLREIRVLRLDAGAGEMPALRVGREPANAATGAGA